MSNRISADLPLLLEKGISDLCPPLPTAMVAAKSLRGLRTAVRPMVTEVEHLRIALLAVKERLEDLLDSTTGREVIPARVRARASRSPVSARLAIVVGHTAKAPGGSGVGGVGPYEYPWNTDLAKLMQKLAPATVQCEIFYRDKIGISGAYEQVAQWQATAAIELHYNNNSGKARGTETLFGPACPRSEAWATAVQAAMVKLYGRQGKYDRGLKKAPPYDRGRESVNALDNIPSCLIEPFFGDNAEDAALGSGKKKELAAALVQTFSDHFAIQAGAVAKRVSRARRTRTRGRAPAVLPPYSPPASAAPFIRHIDLTPVTSFNPGEQLSGLTELRIITNNTVFLDSDLSTDADGSPRARQIDATGQLETAFNFANQTGQARYVNAEVVPYVVLPGSNHPQARPRHEYLYRRLGLQLGDLAAVIWQNRLEFALFADAGPNDLIGEGSIALVESLGGNPWNAARTRIVSGIRGPGVLTFFFPGSKISGLTPQNAVASIRRSGAELFRALGGIVP